MDFLRSFSKSPGLVICCSCSGVSISSTSVLNLFPLKTSATFDVTSVRVHLVGVLEGGGGVRERVWLSIIAFLLANLFLFPLKTEELFDIGDSIGEIGDFGCFFRTA